MIACAMILIQIPIPVRAKKTAGGMARTPACAPVSPEVSLIYGPVRQSVDAQSRLFISPAQKPSKGGFNVTPEGYKGRPLEPHAPDRAAVFFARTGPPPELGPCEFLADPETDIVWV